MNKNDKILIAGTTGMVGSAIIRKLIALGYGNLLGTYHSRKPDAAMFTLDNAGGRLPEALRLVQLDLCDQTAVNRLFDQERPAHVFLAAAKVGGIHANNTYPAEFIRDNLAIQGNVIHAAHQAGVERLLFLGSSCIYPKLAPQPMKEEHLLTGLLEPTNEPYAVAKIAGIKMCEAYNRQYGTRFIAAMPTNLYGPNDSFDLNNAHVLPTLIRKFHLAKLASEGNHDAIRLNEACYGFIPKDINAMLEPALTSKPNSQAGTVTLWGTGTPRREFLHVDDMADACVHIMNLDDDLTVREFLRYPNPCFLNMGTGIDCSIKELAALISNIVGFSGEILYDDSKPDGTPQKLLDVSRLTRLDWRPSITLKSGIEQTYRWYLQSQN